MDYEIENLTKQWISSTNFTKGDKTICVNHNRSVISAYVTEFLIENEIDGVVTNIVSHPENNQNIKDIFIKWNISDKLYTDNRSIVETLKILSNGKYFFTDDMLGLLI